MSVEDRQAAVETPSPRRFSGLLRTLICLLVLLGLPELALQCYRPSFYHDFRRGYFLSADEPPEKGRYYQLYQADRYSIMFNRPNLRLWMKPGQNYICTNHLGFRSREIPAIHPSRTFRIACLGDSVTFAMGVEQQSTYPQQLENMLNLNYPNYSFEVVNAGMPGFSSAYGQQVLDHHVLPLQPDLVTLAYIFNDGTARLSTYSDAQLLQSKRYLILGSQDFLEHFELFWLLRYTLLEKLLKPPSLPAPSAYEVGQRVTSAEYVQNMRGMIQELRQKGLGPILLDTCFPRFNLRPELHQLAREEQVPLISGRDLFEARMPELKRAESTLHWQAGGWPPSVTEEAPPGCAWVRFLARTGKDQPLSGPLSIVSTLPQLGNGFPNKVFLNDEGRQGDAVAGDQTWSLCAALAMGTTVEFAFTSGGTEGHWRGRPRRENAFYYEVYIPSASVFQQLGLAGGDARQGWFDTPVYQWQKYCFDSLMMTGDPVHPNGAGDRILAQELYPLVIGSPQFQAKVLSKHD